MKNNVLQKILPPIFLIIGICITARYLYYVFYFSVNAPLWDDDSILSNLIKIYQEDSWGAKFKYIFKTHNEHIIAYSFLVFILDKVLLGVINLKTISILGNVFLLSTIFTILFSSFSINEIKSKLRVQLGFLGFLFCTLHILSWELLVWPMASILNIHAVSFVIMGLYLLQTKKLSLHYISYLLFFMSTMCSFNGLLSIPLAIYLLLVTKSSNQNYKNDILLMVICSTFIVVFYATLRYTMPSGNASDFDLHSFLNKPTEFIRYCMIVFGGYFYINTGSFVTCYWGGIGVILILIGITVRFKLYNSYPLLFSYLLLFVASAAMICVGRFKLGEGFLFSNLRYFMHSSFIIGIVFIIVSKVLNDKIVSIAIQFGLVVFLGFIYYRIYENVLPQVAQKSNYLKLGMACYRENYKDLFLDIGNGPEILKKCDSLNIYRSDLNYENIKLKRTENLANERISDNLIYNIQPELLDKVILFKFNFAFLQFKDSRKSHLYLVFESPKETLTYEVPLESQYGVANYFNSMKYLNSGFSCVVSKADFKPDNYAINVVIENSGKFYKRYTNISIPM